MLSASISLLFLWLSSVWGQQKASRKKSIALSPANKTRLSYSLRYTQVQRKLCKMRLRKPTANTSEKCGCISFHGNRGKLLAGKVHPFGHLHRLRFDFLRNFTVTSALCSLLLCHHSPTTFWGASLSFGLCAREGEHGAACLAPAACGHGWHGPSKGWSCVPRSGEVQMCVFI